MSLEAREDLVARLRAAFEADDTPSDPIATAQEVDNLAAAIDRERAMLSPILADSHPADIAEAMNAISPDIALRVFGVLDNARAAEVLDELDSGTARYLLENSAPGRIADLLDRLPMDDAAPLALVDLNQIAAEVVADASPARQEALLDELTARSPEDASEVRELLSYGPQTAGRLMTDKYLRLTPTMTVDEAFGAIRSASHEVETLNDLYVTEKVRVNGHTEEKLLGLLSIRQLARARPQDAIGAVMIKEPLTVSVDTDQQDVARLISKYDFLAMPVLDKNGYLAGIVTIDDIIDVLVEEFNEDYMRLSGSDAEELEKKSPAQVAKLRLPWIMATLGIELVASLVIHFFDKTLIKYVLLASFMPVISAISGNTGLQSAAIIIRGLSTGQVQLSQWKTALARQVATTMILGGACAGALGLIGGIWDGHWAFGLVVFLGMFMSVNIAGVVGTIIPLLSKRAGFDPALTAGPFETAFQDVVGISIFLSLASVLLHWLR